MKLVTWNVNSLKQRLPRVLELLDEHRPDVVCLQETKCNPDGFPHEELAAAGYTGLDHSAGRWAGVAVLAHQDEPPRDVVAGLDGEAVPHEARWIEASIGPLRVASVYVPNGRAVGTEPYAQKLAFLDAMRERVAKLLTEHEHLIVAGDMNVAPEDRDVYDPVLFVGSTHVTPEERSRLAALGLADTFRRVNPEAQGFTWWDYRAGHFHKGLGLRIDLVLATPGLAERAVSCGIDRDYRKGSKPSDHAPLLAVFD